MDMILILGAWGSVILLTGLYLTLAKKLKGAVLKTDKVYKELSLVLRDASKEGEGVFSVKKLDENEYFMRLDPDKLFRRGKKI